MIDEFTGGNAGIEKSLGDMYQQEGPANVGQRHGFDMDPKMFEYMGAALAELKK